MRWLIPQLVLLAGCASRPVVDRESVTDIRELSDRKLLVGLEAVRAWEGAPADDILREIVRRGGPSWERHLRDNLTYYAIQGVSLYLDDEGQPMDTHEVRLDVLTTLRRLQGHPDPLRVEILDGRPKMWEGLASPVLEVRLVNQDVDGLAPRVDCDFIGDWAMDLRSPGGPSRPLRFRGFAHEGFTHSGVLYPGQVWSPERDGEPLRLDLARFVDPQAPGAYELRVRYRSGPFAVVSEWIPIEWTAP